MPADAKRSRCKASHLARIAPRAMALTLATLGVPPPYLAKVDLEPALPPWLANQSVLSKPHLALGAPCAADSQCATRACRCPHTFKRRAETCPATGKVCTMLLPVGAECEEHRSCVSRKCYCETDPWKQDDCSGGLRKCCYWSWGYWECEGAFFVEDAAEQQAQHSHDMPQGFVPQPAETPATA